MTERRLTRGLALLLTLCLVIPIAIALADEDAAQMAAYWKIVGNTQHEDPLTRAMNGGYAALSQQEKAAALAELRAVTAEDLLSNKMFPDAIAMGGYPIDIHSPDGAAMKHCFLTPGSWYSVPYGALVTNEVKNLIVAGRCISATHEACAAVRVTPIVMAIGQAAGTAAAQSAKSGEEANALDTDALRESLKAQGVFLEEYRQ